MTELEQFKMLEEVKQVKEESSVDNSRDEEEVRKPAAASPWRMFLAEVAAKKKEEVGGAGAVAGAGDGPGAGVLEAVAQTSLDTKIHPKLANQLTLVVVQLTLMVVQLTLIMVQAGQAFRVPDSPCQGS